MWKNRESNDGLDFYTVMQFSRDRTELTSLFMGKIPYNCLLYAVRSYCTYKVKLKNETEYLHHLDFTDAVNINKDLCAFIFSRKICYFHKLLNNNFCIAFSTSIYMTKDALNLRYPTPFKADVQKARLAALNCVIEFSCEEIQIILESIYVYP